MCEVHLSELSLCKRSVGTYVLYKSGESPDYNNQWRIFYARIIIQIHVP